MAIIRRLSKDNFYYNFGCKWEVIGKYGTDITHTLSGAIRYWLWHCGVSPKIAFWKYGKKTNIY